MDKIDALGQDPPKSGPKCHGGDGITAYVVRPHAPNGAPGQNRPPQQHRPCPRNLFEHRQAAQRDALDCPTAGFECLNVSRPYAGVRASRLAMNINSARNLAMQALVRTQSMLAVGAIDTGYAIAIDIARSIRDRYYIATFHENPDVLNLVCILNFKI
jgi:hypothetical protein